MLSLCEEWDRLSPARQKVIDEQKDTSLINVTAPAIIKAVERCAPKAILDVGCGTGYLTHKIEKYANKCVGVDASKDSIKLAIERYGSEKTVFLNTEIDKIEAGIKFDLCVANMVFSCDPNWEKSVKHIYDLLEKNGELYIMLPHPCFWANYWGIQNEQWFVYNDEIYVEHDFSITNAKALGRATYIHRPLSAYINGLTSSGFMITEIQELEGDKVNKNHMFLFIKCKKP